LTTSLRDDPPRTGAPPLPLALAVALMAAATLLLELTATRLFSVLFFYHFSFFAVSLVMSGLALGGLAVSRWNIRDGDPPSFRNRLAALALAFSALTLLALLSLVTGHGITDELSIGTVAVRALAFLPGLVAAGAFLAAAFAREERWIGRLYAADLVAAALACLLAIVLMRVVQGPAMLLCPALLGGAAGLALRPRREIGFACGLVALLALAGAGWNAAGDGGLLRLAGSGRPLFERWNEHSRITVYPVRRGREMRRILIDRSAATYMRRVQPRQPGGPLEIDPLADRSVRYLAYRLGRPAGTVAVIGVGGGDDLAPPLLHGARRIDGYEINGILVDLLALRFADFNAIASRPEVHLIHDEARVGIAHSGRRYDVIQASLIDTWAATASGGFVLSENGLYTLEGWRIFLSALSDRGLLTMTRWLIPSAPAETQRLVSLAAAALAGQGIGDPRSHILLAGAERSPGAKAWLATILVSRAPFTADEVGRFLAVCRSEGIEPLLVPDRPPADPVIARLTDPTTRRRAVEESLFDISPPTDERPYFFLQVRPGDVLSLSRRTFGSVTEITFNGIRVLIILSALALLLTLSVLLLAAFTRPSAGATPAQRAVYRWMSPYFLGIGVGYMLLQLGFHQRLILILGHPTFALSIVLAAMLLGTGLGAAASDRLFAPGHPLRAWLTILAVLAALTVGLPLIRLLERIGSSPGRAAGAATVLVATGFVLGFAFPIGIRLVAPTGPWAVQKMWAVNGAASIAGSALAALLGITFGSRAVLAAGLAAYALATLCGWRAARLAARGEIPSHTPAPALSTVAQVGRVAPS
jgi:hypothetical protein